MSIFVDIEKHFQGFTLKAKFEVQNEVISLLGASGCGKSMILKCIAGIVKPDKGKIILDDVTLFDSEKKINLSTQKRRVGLLFQNYALFPNMTVLQNIKAGSLRDKKKDDSEIERVIEKFGLSDLKSRFPHQLSGGQQQRVALARILVSAPNILMLDEPFSALDTHLRFTLEKELKKVIKDFKKTVIFVSHNRDEVFRFSDKIAVMNNGNIEVFVDKDEVFSYPTTKEAALLTGCKNISRLKKLDNGKIEAVDFGLIFNKPADDENYIGIRRHDVLLGKGENSCECKIVGVIENPFSYIISLNPIGKPSNCIIDADISKEQYKNIDSENIFISITNEKIMLLY